MAIVGILFAPVWALVWHWGAGIALVILLLFAAYVSPLYKQWFLGGAGIVMLVLIAYGAGIVDADRLCTARVRVEQARTTAKVKDAVRKAKAHYREQKDPYDDRNN